MRRRWHGSVIVSQSELSSWQVANSVKVFVGMADRIVDMILCGEGKSSKMSAWLGCKAAS